MPDTPTLSVPQQLKDLSLPQQLADVPQQLKDLTHEISVPHPSLPSRRARRRAARKLRDAIPTPAAKRRRRDSAIGRGLLVSLSAAATIAAIVAVYNAVTNGKASEAPVAYQPSPPSSS